VRTAIARATKEGCPRLLLWTQTAMTAAQQLYESDGFTCKSRYERNGREFLICEKNLATADAA
jgi:GNAT superfamily N-acetyltransferase